jgi:hypothetical protein
MPVIPMKEEAKKRGRGRPKSPLVQSKIIDPVELQLFWSAIVRGEIGDDGEAPRLNERLRASELLAKASNLFNTNITVNANTNPIEALSDEELEAKMKHLLDVIE